MVENGGGAATQLTGIVGPNAGAPIAETAGLRDEEIEKGVAIPMLGGARVTCFFSEQCTDFVDLI